MPFPTSSWEAVSVRKADSAEHQCRKEVMAREKASLPEKGLFPEKDRLPVSLSAENDEMTDEYTYLVFLIVR